MHNANQFEIDEVRWSFGFIPTQLPARCIVEATISVNRLLRISYSMGIVRNS